MEPRGYDYGGGGAGGKIRRHHPSRVAAASPYARPAAAPAPAAAASQGGGWFSRIITAGASRLLPSLFRKLPPQITAPAPPRPPLEPLEETPSRYLLLEPRPEPLDAPPSPPSVLPPPLEDDLPQGEENNGAIANDNMCIEDPQSPTKEKEDMLRSSDNDHGMDLEELLKQKTFTRSECQYLSELLWSRTIGSNSLRQEGGSIRNMPVSMLENGPRHSNLPVDFSITTYSVADQVASPAEIAKAYMASNSSKGSTLRLRLHDPSMPIKSMEASMIKKAKPPTIPLIQTSRLHTSKTSDCLESNYTTPNGSAIYKMSSSSYFKSGVSSKDLFSSVSSPYATPSSVHTSSRQVLKRKSTAVNNETVSVGPVRRLHQRYNRGSPLLQTRPGYRRYLGSHGSKYDEGSEQLGQTQKRRCLDKVVNPALGSIDDKAHTNSFGQAPVQSAEMAAKILKQLDTLVPAQKENVSELKQKHGNLEFRNPISPEKELSAQSNHLVPPPSDAMDAHADVTEKLVDATTNKTDNKMPPTSSLRNHATNLVLSSEIDRNKMSISSNGFTFPVQSGLGAHSVAPPTPTLASPPILPVEKQQPSTVLSSNTSMESNSRISQPVPEEGSHKVDNKLNVDDKPMLSKNSGQGASFTGNPVFKVVNSKTASLSSGPGHMLNSAVSAIQLQPSTGSTKLALFQFAGSSNSALKPAHSSSTGGSFTFSNTGMGNPTTSNMFVGTTSQSVVAPSLASSGTGNPSATFGLSPFFGTVSSSAALDKSKAVGSSTPFSSSQQFGIASSSVVQDKSKPVGTSTPFGFSQQSMASSTAQDISKAVPSEPTVLFGNQNGHSGNNNSLFSQNSVNNLNSKPSEKPNNGNSQSFTNSQAGSAPLCSSPFNSSSIFPWASGSGSTSVAATAPPSSATSSGFGSSPASSTSQMFGSNSTTPASFGLPNNGPSTSLFSPPPSAIFSFTSSTPSIPNPSPTTPFGGPTVQMNVGNMAADRNGSPFPTASPFGLASSSPSTPIFSTPATQFASNTSSSPGIFGFDQQSQASSGGFSMGPGGGNDKSGRRIIRVKKRK